MRRLEDKIRRLCTQVLATDDEDALRPMLVQLRSPLHQHDERFRGRIANYPFLVERRTRNGILPFATPASQNAAKETSATTRTEETNPDNKNAWRTDESPQ